MDGSSNYVYRTNEFPGLGFMLKKSLFNKHMKNKLSTCCADRAWNNWELIDQATGKQIQLDVLIPDVSRVFRRPYDLSRIDFPLLKNLFNRKRKTNLLVNINKEINHLFFLNLLKLFY